MSTITRGMITFEADKEGELRKGQSALARALGHTLDTLPHCFFDLLSPGSLQLALGSWRALYNGSTLRNAEVDLIRQDGLSVPFKMSLYPGVDEVGGVPSVSGVLASMGPQWDLSHALEVSEERFGAVFEMSSDAILILSEGGQLLSVNPAFERLTGLRPEHFYSSNQSWLDVFSEEEHRLLRIAMHDCTERNINHSVECRMRTLEGLKWFDVSLNPLHDAQDRVKGLVLIARDIHQRKEIEFELTMEAEELGQKHQQSQQLIGRMRNILKEMSSLPASTTAFMDGATHLLSGRFPQCVISLDTYSGGDDDVGLIQPSSEFFLQSLMHQELLSSRAPLLCNDLPANLKYREDSMVVNFRAGSFLGAPMLDASGHIQGTLALICQDRGVFFPEDVEMITMISILLAGRLRGVEMEEQRMTLENHLRHSQKMEAVGNLAGGVAHEFNNILSGILGFSSYLVDKLEPESDVRKDIEMIQKSAEHASVLTRQLLTFARKRHFEKKPVDLNRVVGEASSILRHSIPKRVAVKLELEEGLPLLLGSDGQLTQVVMNLCINASHAIGEGKGSVVMCTEYRGLSYDERLLLGSHQVAAGDPYIVLTVRDDGPGMSEEVLEHVFEPFFTTKGEEGTGLGLSIVYGIISNHEGDLSVQSKEGVGSVFTIILPAAPDKKLEFDALKDVALEGSERLLLIDDDAAVRAVVCESMGEYGYTVQAVGSGPEGVEVLQSKGCSVDLVLLDMIMPDMDGVDVYNILAKRFPGVPILVVSGYASEERFAQIVAKKPIAFLEKPFKTSQLARRIRMLLDEAVV